MSVRPAKTQISLGICPVWSESLLCAQWVAKDPRFLHANREDSDQTGGMPRLIWVFAGRTAILLVLSCRGSITFSYKLNNILHIHKSLSVVSIIFLQAFEIISLILSHISSGTDKNGIWWWLRDNFAYFSIKTYVVGTHWNRLAEEILRSTHNISFMENWQKL